MSTRTGSVDIGRLVLGVILLGAAGLWAILTVGLVDLDQLQLWLPVPLLVAGGVGVVALGLSRGTRRATLSPPPPDTASAPPRATVWDEQYEAERRADLAERIRAAAAVRSAADDDTASHGDEPADQPADQPAEGPTDVTPDVTTQGPIPGTTDEPSGGPATDGPQETTHPKET